MKLVASTSRAGEVVQLTFGGEVTEASDFPDLKLEGVTRVDLNVGGVTYINSGGVQGWTNWVRDFGQRFPKTLLSLEKLPLILTRQLISVKGFVPRNSRIQSFYALYYCPDCDQEAQKLLIVGKDFRFDKTQPELIDSQAEMKCATCAKPMEIDMLIDHLRKITWNLF